MFRLGVNSNNECGKTFKEILKRIKIAGFTDVMVAAKEGTLENTLKYAKKLGLNVPYAHLSYKKISSIWAKGESSKKIVENAIKELNICAKYNVKIAVLHVTYGNASDRALEPNEIGLMCINKILEVAKKLDIKIAIENLDAPNFQNTEYVLENIKSDHLGFCYDSGHHNLYMPKVDLLKKYGDRLLAIHLDDNLMDWEYGYDYTRDLHLLPFDGKVDFEKVCMKLSKLNFGDVVMLEIHKNSCGEPRLYNNVDGLEFLKEAKIRAEKLRKMIENNIKIK